MAFEFTALPRAAQRAAFANMAAEDKADSTALTATRTRGLGSGARHQRLSERHARSENQVEKLRRAFDQGHALGESLEGGFSADSVEEIALADGQRAVLKGQTERDTRAEYLGGRVANALGITDVYTAQVSPNQTVTTFVDGDTGGSLLRKAVQGIDDDDEKRAAVKAEVRRHTQLENGREIALLDWLTQNDDRNVFNWIVSPDGQKVVPIDHGSADFRPSEFTDRQTGETREVVPRSPFVEEWVRPTTTGYRELESMDPQWTAEELAETRAALGSVASEFRGQDEQGWYRSMLRRLAMLEEAL